MVSTHPTKGYVPEKVVGKPCVYIPGYQSSSTVPQPRLPGIALAPIQFKRILPDINSGRELNYYTSTKPRPRYASDAAFLPFYGGAVLAKPGEASRR